MKTLLTLIAFVSALSASAQGRKEINLAHGWEFSHDRISWQAVSVPHDWAIAGPFDKANDLQVFAIEQNGEQHAYEHSGRTGALPWMGEGYYRLTLPGTEGYAHAELSFDGAMAEPVVYVNGHKAGQWAYGYNAFRVDITPYLKPEGDNQLEVTLHTMSYSSRWYPGAGLYRPVTLVLTGEQRLDPWQTFVRTLSIGKKEATLAVDVQTANPDIYVQTPTSYASTTAPRHIVLTLTDSEGQVVAEADGQTDDAGLLSQQLTVGKPRLWSPESPYLYSLNVELRDDDGRTLDRLVIPTGIRTVSVSAEGGFQLNGVSRKIRGVCLHHDHGPLGAATNRAALIRQVRILKEMGCDAIRTSHHMPSQQQMQVYDSLGMMVMAESFDEWEVGKMPNGYNRFWADYWEKDITTLVVNHRNHPSLVMWCIGNEIPEQHLAGSGVDNLKKLQAVCHRLDPTRPVTTGIDQVDSALGSGFAAAIEVPGFNYRTHKYDTAHAQLPQGVLLGSETTSTVSSRGVYHFPVEPRQDYASDDGQCSSYDLECGSWSNLMEDDFTLQDDRPWVIGQFVWTGFDYLGEPTPHDLYWPSRSSYFGICDMAGLPKDRYYFYRSQWRTDEHTIHLLPHWTWPDRVGQVTPVYCYTDCPTAELFVNGKSQGRITKNADSKFDRYRLRWNDVVYEPGELRVVVYDRRGKRVGQQVVRTAGEPASLLLEPDRTTLSATGDDLAYITVSLRDANGTLVPRADDEISVEVSGAGTFRGICNGDATSLESFVEPHMHLFSGQLVVVVQASEQPGDLTLTVRGRGLESSVTLAVE